MSCNRLRNAARRFALCGALCYWLTSSGALAAPAPTAPATSTGSYTVSYTACSGCYAHWLEERAGATGPWITVGQGSQSFADKPAGRYDYRVAHLYLNGAYYSGLDYSSPATVLVGSVTSRAPLADQFRRTFTARGGDLDGDGRRDIYLARSDGVSSADGTIGHVILRNTGSGGFEALSPSATRIATAGAWPAIPLAIDLRDINTDGYVDIVLTRLDRTAGYAGSRNLIVFAPGSVGRTLPLALRSYDAALDAFAGDAFEYLKRPDYFEATAPIRVVQQVYVQTICYQDPGGSWSDYGYYPCYPVPILVTTSYPDYSAFDPVAVDIWREEQRIADGTISAGTGLDRIDAHLERLLDLGIGSRDVSELIGPEAANLDLPTLRGIDLFSAIAGIASAHADEEDISAADDRVLIKGRRVFASAPFHTVLEYGGATISAYDSDRRPFYDGTLVSAVNWAPDHPSLTLLLGAVDAAEAPAAYWSRLLALDARYDDDLPYDLVPSVGYGGYNSNSYVSGIVAASAGHPTVPMTSFIGGERPVPATEFN